MWSCSVSLLHLKYNYDLSKVLLSQGCVSNRLACAQFLCLLYQHVCVYVSALREIITKLMQRLSHNIGVVIVMKQHRLSCISYSVRGILATIHISATRQTASIMKVGSMHATKHLTED